MKFFSFQHRNNGESWKLKRSSGAAQAEELISNPAQIYKEFHEALGIKTRKASSLSKCPFDESPEVWDKVMSGNSKLEAMQEGLNEFFDDWITGEVFSDSEFKELKSRVSDESSIEDRLGTFAELISNKLAEYFNTVDPFDAFVDRQFGYDENFFGGVQNQISTTVSLIRVAFDKLVESHQAYQDLGSKLMGIVKNLDSTLYGFSKTQFQALRKVFNILGHNGSIPPPKFQYSFNKNYFGFDSIKNPQELLPKKKLVKDLKFWSKYFPFIREGRKFQRIPKSIPAFGCPALAVKAPNGDNFIKVVHGFICESFEKAFLPSLDQVIRLESS